MPEEQTPPAPETPPADDKKVTPPPPAEKPEGEVAPKTETKETPPARVVPEKYELKLPEGSPLAPDAVAKVAEFAKAKGLTNDEAQAVLERENASVAAYVEGQKVTAEKEVSSWLDKAKTDKEIGGDGFNQNAELAKRVIERFGSVEFKDALNRTGFGNHPELVRVFVRIGKMMSEDQLVLPGSQAPGKKSLEEVFYPKQDQQPA